MVGWYGSYTERKQKLLQGTHPAKGGDSGLRVGSKLEGRRVMQQGIHTAFDPWI